MTSKTFNDKKNRAIELVITDGSIQAYHENTRIGKFDYEAKEIPCDYHCDYYYELWGMNIDEKYQRAGIGLEILKLGEEHFGQGNVVYPQDGTENYPTLEGAKLLNAAIKKGIIHCYSEDDEQEPDDEFEYANYEDNPNEAEPNKITIVEHEILSDEDELQSLIEEMNLPSATNLKKSNDQF